MLAGFYQALMSEPGLLGFLVKLTGTGASAPTKNYGPGLTVTRTGVGAYRLTFAEHPGTLVALSSPAFGDSTPADVKNLNLTWDTDYTASGKVLDIAVWDSAGAARELAATEVVAFIVWFKMDSIGAV